MSAKRNFFALSLAGIGVRMKRAGLVSIAAVRRSLAWFWIKNTSARRGTWLRLLVDVAAIAVAGFAFATWKEAIDAREVDQRAWLAPTAATQIAESPLTLGKPMPFYVYYNNTGKEPALDLNYKIDPQFLLPEGREQTGDWGSFRAGNNSTCGSIETLSGGPSIYPSPIGAYVISQALVDLRKVAEVHDAKSVFVVKGCLKYRTVRHSHHAAFCFYLQPEAQRPPPKWIFRNCPDGSGAD